MIDFPANPTVGFAFSVGNTIYKCVATNPAVWSATIATSGIPDAPADANTYGRKQAAWDILTKNSVGLNNVDNTSDVNKPVSTAQAAADNLRVLKAGDTMTGALMLVTPVFNDWSKRAINSEWYFGQAGSGNPAANGTAAPGTSSLWSRQDHVHPLQVNISGTATNATQINSIALQWRDPGGGNPAYVMCATSPSDAYVRPPSALSVGYANNSGQVSGVGGWAYSNWANNPVYLWATEGDSQAQHLTRPENLSVAWANRVGSVDGAGGGRIAGSVQIAGDNVIDLNIKTYGGHWWRWHWNGDVGDNHFYAFVDNGNQGWAQLNSDERLKEDIQPLVSDTAKFMQLQPVNFKWRIMHAITDNSKRVDGLIAQNVRALFPDATFGDFDTPPDADGKIMFPGSVDDRAILAHVIVQLQRLILRVDALEAQP